MANDHKRSDRVADSLKKELAQLIQRSMNDPRVAGVSITDVEVSRDLAHAKVFVTVIGKDDLEQAKPAIESLNKAAGFLRSSIARDDRMRSVPKLRFFYDDTLSKGRKISDLIALAVSEINSSPED
jgi:ribosome-binding factor A